MNKFIPILFTFILLSVTLISKIKISDFYSLVFYQDDNEHGFYPTPNSFKNNLELSNFAENMYGFNIYLHSNYSKAEKLLDSLTYLLPDTNKAITEYNRFLEEDEAFKNIFFSSFYQKKIPPIRIDSILNIVSKFFYVHYFNGKALAHLCAGINGIDEIQQTEYSPFYNAFSFMVLYNETGLQKFIDITAPYSNELNKNSKEKRVLEIKKNVYYAALKDTEIREMIINEYEKKKEFLNFEIIY